MSIVASITEYLKGAREELKKVVWPSREETTRSAGIVIGMSLAVAAFFWILDQVFNFTLGFLLK